MSATTSPAKLMRAIVVEEFGGPEVLCLREVPAPEAHEGLVPLEVLAAGINYADTHQAENTYHTPATLPLIPGAEVIGRTPDGERIVALLPGGGGYAERALVSQELSVPVPEGVEDGQALAVILQGLTAWHLLRTSARMQPGESVVVHAAAGGVGTFALQLAKRWGAGRVIAVASSEQKRSLALELGADSVIFSDISLDLLEHCRGIIQQIGVLDQSRFLLTSAASIALQDASVDAITTRSVLIYVKAKQQAFQEFFRVLKTMKYDGYLGLDLGTRQPLVEGYRKSVARIRQIASELIRQ